MFLALIPLALVGLVMLLRLARALLTWTVALALVCIAVALVVVVPMALFGIASDVSDGTRSVPDLIVPVCGIAFLVWCFGGFRYLAERFEGKAGGADTGTQMFLGKPTRDWDTPPGNPSMRTASSGTLLRDGTRLQPVRNSLAVSTNATVPDRHDNRRRGENNGNDSMEN